MGRITGAAVNTSRRAWVRADSLSVTLITSCACRCRGKPSRCRGLLADASVRVRERVCVCVSACVCVCVHARARVRGGGRGEGPTSWARSQPELPLAPAEPAPSLRLASDKPHSEKTEFLTGQSYQVGRGEGPARPGRGRLSAAQPCCLCSLSWEGVRPQLPWDSGWRVE